MAGLWDRTAECVCSPSGCCEPKHSIIASGETRHLIIPPIFFFNAFRYLTLIYPLKLYSQASLRDDVPSY